MEQVEGNDKGKIVLYALSTCGWCGRVKRYLEKSGVSYSFIHMDLLSEAENKEAMQELVRWNPRMSYPTIVINDNLVIEGYNEAKIKEAIGL